MYENYADIFKCFAHRSRIKLMQLLASAEELSVKELAETLEVKHSTVSKHLNTLRLQGLVSFQRQEQLKYYSLNLEEIQRVFADFLGFLQVGQDKLLETIQPYSHPQRAEGPNRPAG